jgi:hypothetical protein
VLYEHPASGTGFVADFDRRARRRSTFSRRRRSLAQRAQARVIDRAQLLVGLPGADLGAHRLGAHCA